MYQRPRAVVPAPARGSILSTLQAADMSDTRRLPAEIIAAVLNYLPVADQVRCARASRKLREMVYDDTRWVARLKSMGCWDEVEARRRFDEAVQRKRREAAERAAERAAAASADPRANRQSTITLFDATTEGGAGDGDGETRRRSGMDIRDGFQVMSLAAAAAAALPPPPPPPNETSMPQDPTSYLAVLRTARSIRGLARQEYGRIYGALAPFYFDLMRAKSHTDPAVFKAFRDPERQAQMLANLNRFAKSDWAAGWSEREEKLTSMLNIFETAVLREFEQGYELWDVDGRMRRYAHVLHTLNGGAAAIELFIQKHPILNDRRGMPNPIDCINHAAQDEVSLEPSRAFFEALLSRVNEQAAVVGRIFPQPQAVFWALVDRIREDVVMEYTVPLFEQAHERSIASYLKAISGLFDQGSQFYKSVVPPTGGSAGSAEEVAAKARELSLATFDPHLDTYLREELEFFIRIAESEVREWDKKMSEQAANVESFYMGSFNRQAAKKDFLTSFKKVVMMPVAVLPTIGLPIGSPFATAAAKQSSSTTTAAAAAATSAQPPSRPGTPILDGGKRTSTSIGGLPTKAPDDELAAKAALMASRLEGIKSLCSIEVALNLVHAAKSSLNRASVFIPLGGQWGGEAREQCGSIFLNMLRILGSGHIKTGFDMAIDHLSQYNPRAVIDHSKSSSAGVAPLVMFIELVNVGDLILQMVDVFYEQQLVAPKITDKNDFLDQTVLAKKKFEQMLDESVAAGLNKGIDVLMDEVEYLNSTTQLPTDYNPLAGAGAGSGAAVGAGAGAGAGSGATSASASAAGGAGGAADRSSSGFGLEDIGPTPTARSIVELVSRHTRMLAGTTEKSMLEVFNGEVGLRLFNAVCKHLKRQRISTGGAIKLIADMNLYSDYVETLRNQDLMPYFRALRELSQIYLIDARHAKEMAAVIADGDRFGGVFRAEEVYEFAQRRADWYQVRRDVERAMYGLECGVM